MFADSTTDTDATIEERAARFRAACPCRTRTVDGTTWSFYEGGSGPTVLLLTGGIGMGIAWVDLALALRRDHRVVAVDYPALTSADALADGVAALVGDVPAHVVGQSFGSMLAEVFSRREPQRVRSLVLSGCGLYTEEDRARLHKSHASITEQPWESVREQYRRSFRETLDGSPELPFWLGELDTVTAGEQGRTRMSATFPALLGLIDALPRLQAEPAWPGPTLVVAAEDDGAMTEPRRRRLLDMHPDAQVRLYPDGGHSLLITRPADYIRDVTAFLARHR
jgi:pimeloyl-ACP methyl ester carboxylesterase